MKLSDIASQIFGNIVNGNADLDIQGIADIRDASQNQIAVFSDISLIENLESIKASAIVTSEKIANDLKDKVKTLTIVSVRDSYLAMALLTKIFHEEKTSIGGFIHPSASVSPNAKVSSSAVIHANVVISDYAEIADGVEILSGTVIGENVKILENTKIFPRVVIYDNSVIGCNTRIHAGVVIGSDGFGYARNKTGPEKIWHFGKVIIGNNVEIGANTAIDRGTMRNTVIGNNVKIDNLVQIGHNVVLEDNVVICGCTALAGGSKVKRNALIAGASGVVDKVVIGENSVVGAFTLVTNDVPPNKEVVGCPHRERKDYLKVEAALSRLPEFIKRFRNDRKNLSDKT